jgi:hypothetical protein
MIYHGNWRPNSCVMAIFAEVGCQDVLRALAGRVGTVVATEAIVAYVGMIEVCRYPCDG